MRPIIAILIALFVLLQYQLWFASGGIVSVCYLNENINHQIMENQKLKDRNTALLADIDDLKHGAEAIEEHARNDLGMIKKSEVFYQIVK
ncbi:cell division protein FtsB [Coxiella endosymbiont of Ornithodoros maritimus]|uniref:cell division protein FtsB n=1 Tax=Coxiella endosymbiont of Ornithodoros maritimus TaxID=1656172 RepID=UPI002263B8BE|nr:cell division protein FtsB [Coxiella endosymbiont of Ornithodoros maritimus]